jgi:hypothetical protein
MAHQLQGGPPDPVGRIGTLLLGAYFIALPIVVCIVMVLIWPYVIVPPDGKVHSVAGDMLFDMQPVSSEVTFIVLVIVSGALGSYVHSATSFADYVGNRRLAASWIWWYLLRSFIGLSLAMLFYFVVRGGLLSAGASAGTLSPFGIAAVSGLTGLFSKQATDKMREVFDTLFRTERPVFREDRLANPAPVVTAIEPERVSPASPDVRLVVHGRSFIPSSVIRFAATDYPTTYVSPTQLEATIPAGALTAIGDFDVTVYSPPPGGGSSTATVFQIE